MTEEVSPSFLIKIINLDRRKDRMEMILKNLAFTSFRDYPIERFSAINGIDLIEDIKSKNLYNDIVWKVLKNQCKKNISRGELGCLLSHYFLLKKIWKDPMIDIDQMIIVMEDDVHFSKCNYSEEISDILDFTQSNYFDFCYISGRFEKNFFCKDEKMFTEINNHFYERISGEGFKWDRTTNSYIIKKQSIPVILDSFIKLLSDKFVAVDHIFCRSKVISYDYFPHLFYSPANYSTDIQGHHRMNTINVEEFQKFIKS